MFIRVELITVMLSLSVGLIFPTYASAAEGMVPQLVHFKGPGAQPLIGYLFRPGQSAGRAPGIILLHGRTGPYSTAANGLYDATTLSKRHELWGRFWAEQGYYALLVDSFSTRGYPEGFPIHSYDERPDAVNEVTVRPFDAYAGLAYLKQQFFIDASRIALQGWSNGGSATIAAMAQETAAKAGVKENEGFAGAIAFYPACTLHHEYDASYLPYAPVRVFSGDEDEEVSAERCRHLVTRSRAAGNDIEIVVYHGATHDFDDPGVRRQRVKANAEAAQDAFTRARNFIIQLFRR
jgi:dienelactone hydrolase